MVSAAVAGISLLIGFSFLAATPLLGSSELSNLGKRAVLGICDAYG